MLIFIIEMGVMFCVYMYGLLFVRLWGLPGIFACFVTMLWLPNTNRLAERTRHSLADELDNSNPLYAKGHMRKKASRKCLVADLKGLYYCQMVLIPLYLCASVYMIYSYCHNYKRFGELDVFFITSFAGLFLVWIGFKGYYCLLYDQCFRYTENEKGIWKPFSYIAKPPNLGFYRPFHCLYRVKYEEMKENLVEGCDKKGYAFSVSSELKEDGEEVSFFARRRGMECDIFALIHIKECSDEYMEKLNDLFSDYWSKLINDTGEIESAAIIFLLCIDEYNTPLKKKLLSVLSVDQKKGRYRLPAILTYSEHSSLDILANYSDLRGKEKYKKMRKELLWLLGISERFNGKRFPEEEEVWEKL